jgi:hypothetical protein
MAKLIVPESLRSFFNNQGTEVHVPIDFLNEFPDWVQKNHPTLYRILFDSSSPSIKRLGGFLNLYLKDSSVTYRLNEQIPLEESDSLRLVTSISGG